MVISVSARINRCGIELNLCSSLKLGGILESLQELIRRSIFQSWISITGSLERIIRRMFVGPQVYCSRSNFDINLHLPPLDNNELEIEWSGDLLSSQPRNSRVLFQIFFFFETAPGAFKNEFRSFQMPVSYQTWAIETKWSECSDDREIQRIRRSRGSERKPIREQERRAISKSSNKFRVSSANNFKMTVKRVNQN